MTPNMSCACRRCVYPSLTFFLLCVQKKSGMTYRNELLSRLLSVPLLSAFLSGQPAVCSDQIRAERCTFSPRPASRVPVDGTSICRDAVAEVREAEASAGRRRRRKRSRRRMVREGSLRMRKRRRSWYESEERKKG